MSPGSTHSAPPSSQHLFLTNLPHAKFLMELRSPKYKAYHETLTPLSHFTLQKRLILIRSTQWPCNDLGRVPESCELLRSQWQRPSTQHAPQPQIREKAQKSGLVLNQSQGSKCTKLTTVLCEVSNTVKSHEKGN